MMPQHIAFLNDNLGLSPLPLKTGGVRTYPPEHVRFVMVLNGADPIVTAKIAKACDPTLGTMLGVMSKPSDHTFREAWRHVAGSIVVDMPAARTIHLERLLSIRDAKMSKVVVAAVRGDEQAKSLLARLDGMDTALPPLLAAAKTPEDLAVVIPADLNENPPT